MSKASIAGSVCTAAGFPRSSDIFAVSHCVAALVQRITARGCLDTVQVMFDFLIIGGGIAGRPMPVGLRPLRRTAILVEGPAGVAVRDWPFVVDVEEKYYFKPDAGLILVSPAEETLSSACDAQPDDLDVAIGVDHVERVTTVTVQPVRKAWAGLRTFVADRSPVIGYDDLLPDFFWLAALGGYGIQTAPAVGWLAACMARHAPLDTIPGTTFPTASLAPGRAACSAWSGQSKVQHYDA